MPPPVLKFRTAGPWGAGELANLQPVDVDNNFWSLREAIVDLQENPTLPNNILDIQVSGNLMTIIMDDLSTFGPFALPTATFVWRGDWEPDTEYNLYDFLLAGGSMYLVLQNHLSAGTFSPDAGNVNGPYYQLIFETPTVYDIGFAQAGKPGIGISIDEYSVLSGTMFQFRCVRPFYLAQDLPDTRAGTLFAATSDMTFEIYRNDVQIGQGILAGGQSVLTFVFPANEQFIPGDVLRVRRDFFLDTTARDLSWTFAATKGTIPNEVS